MAQVPWSAGRWTHAPAAVVERDGDLLVTAVEGSDAWRVTSYGFVHDSEHALVVPFANGSAMEVEFTAVFRTPTPDEADEQKAIEDYLARGQLSVRTGFIGLGKDEEHTFTPELKEKLLTSEWTSLGLMKAYGEFRSGSPAKN